ncbi:hypothetical protein G9A89_023342 [Geosiphon pyriformis]|nr:hypothetical protein G9A89_023342 [Geosiphon pyriformis]
MITTRAKSKKAVFDIFSEISNKISTKKALSVVEATRQNVLEAFPLLSNCEKLSLVTIKATFLSLTGLLLVKISSKRHTWISPSVVSTSTKSPKVFNNRLVNKLVFLSIALMFGVFSTFSLKKWSKKPKVQKNLCYIIQYIIQNRPRSITGCVAKYDVFQQIVINDQIDTELSFSLVSGTTFGGVWKIITSFSTLVPGATFKIKLAYFKTVFQSIHGFLDAKSVSKNNVKLFCVEFAFQNSLDAAFLVEFTSSVCLATLKIAKFLVVSKFGFSSVAIVLHDVLLGVSAANIKTSRSAGIWQYIVVYFKNLDAITSVLNYWLVLAKLVNFFSDCTAFEISNMISQSPNSGYYLCFVLVTFGFQTDLNLIVVKTVVLSLSSKAVKMFKSHFVGFLSYAKTSGFSILSEFSPLVASVFSVAVANSLMFSQLASLKSGLAKLSILIESIIKPVGNLVTTFEQFIKNDLISSSKLGNKINELMAHLSAFSKSVGKLKREMVALKTKYSIENVDLSGDFGVPIRVSDKIFGELMALWKFKSFDVKFDLIKTAKWLVRLVPNSLILFDVIQKMFTLNKFSYELAV